MGGNRGTRARGQRGMMEAGVKQGASDATTRRVGGVARRRVVARAETQEVYALYDSRSTHSTPATQRTKGVVRKPQQDGGLANTRIADKQELEQMVIVVRLWRECIVVVVVGAPADATRGTGNVMCVDGRCGAVRWGGEGGRRAADRRQTDRIRGLARLREGLGTRGWVATKHRALSCSKFARGLP